MSLTKRKFKSDPATGFGVNSRQSGGRFYRKDGTPNIIRRGIGILDRISWFHTLLSIPNWQFWLLILGYYIVMNLLFGSIYYLIGIEHLAGIQKGSEFNNFAEAFFFSTQTFTTVGYGRISPVGLLTSGMASFEAFLGLMTLALATGLFFGRFARPRSYLTFSDNALISPYRNGIALMFRTVPYKNNLLMDAEVKLTLGMRVTHDGVERNEFYPLQVELSRITALMMNWTIVHPINEESPIYGLTIEDLKKANAQLMVYIKAFDEVFSNTVVARTSYTANEIVEGAKFKQMYYPSSSGTATILNIDALNDYELVDIK
ncbi:MAG: Inward rectifier potassium channel Irk [Chitinophagaceae bacterium]|nr:Inward rectifier potassium channel Irk [Chitinophagaceae bacterium]